MERYALLWLFATAVLLALAIWTNALERLASAVGIAYAPSALFTVAFAFMLILLLHFSLVISRLADQNKILAQRVGQLRERIDRVAGDTPAEGPDQRTDENETVDGQRALARER